MDNVPNEYRHVIVQKSNGVFTSSLSGNFDAFGRLRVSNPVTLFDSQNRYKTNDKFYSNVLSGGSVTYSSSESSVLLNVTTTPGSYTARESRFVFNYQPGKSLLILCTDRKSTRLNSSHRT